MSWFRLDDNGYDHDKVLAAGDRAYGVWCRAGQFSSNKMTDGFVSKSAARRLCGDVRVWKRLVDVGLLDHADGGYQIHDFLVYNPSRKAVEDKSNARREAGRKGGEAKAQKDRERTAKEPGENCERTAKELRTDLYRIGNEPRTDESENNGQVCENTNHDCGNDHGDCRSTILPRPVPSRPLTDPPIVPQGTPVAKPDIQPSLIPSTKPTEQKASDAQTVFNHWQTELMPKAKQTDRRIARINARLAEGFTVEELVKAIDGAKKDDFLMGRDPKSRPGGWRDIDTVLRDAGQVERLSALAEESDSESESWEPWSEPTSDPRHAERDTGIPMPEELKTALAAFAGKRV